MVILGDKLDSKGDTFDVAYQLKNFSRNKHAPVVCIGGNNSLAGKIMSLLKPYVERCDPRELSLAKEKIKIWLKKS